MKKNIYFIDVHPMAASKILEALKAYLNDNNIEANLRMIVLKIDDEVENYDVEYYKDVYDELGISFEERDHNELESIINHMDNENSLVLLNALRNKDAFYFCKNLLDARNIKYALIGIKSWYEEENKYNSKIKEFKTTYEQTIGEEAPEIFAGANLMVSYFVEKDAKRLLELK